MTRRQKTRINTTFVAIDGSTGTRSQTEDILSLHERIFARLQKIDEASTNRLIIPGANAYDGGDYEVSLGYFRAAITEVPAFKEELRPHLNICRRVIRSVLSLDDLEYGEACRNQDDQTFLKRWSQKKLPLKLRCKYCGHFTPYLPPNRGMAYLGGNNCYVCGRGYPMPDFTWDGVDGQAYIYYRGSVTEEEFYTEFETQFDVEVDRWALVSRGPKKPTVAKCKECAAELLDAAHYCNSCGASIDPRSPVREGQHANGSGTGAEAPKVSSVTNLPPTTAPPPSAETPRSKADLVLQVGLVAFGIYLLGYLLVARVWPFIERTRSWGVRDWFRWGFGYILAIALMTVFSVLKALTLFTKAQFHRLRLGWASRKNRDSDALSVSGSDLPMSYYESLSVAWLWEWRGDLFAAGAATLVSLFGKAATELLSQTFIWVVTLWVFAIALTKMMLRKRYAHFDLRIKKRQPGEIDQPLTFAEQIPLVWYLFWRFTALDLIVWEADTISNDALIWVGAGLYSIVTLLVVKPWVIRTMLRKRFRDFSVELVRVRIPLKPNDDSAAKPITIP